MKHSENSTDVRQRLACAPLNFFGYRVRGAAQLYTYDLRFYDSFDSRHFDVFGARLRQCPTWVAPCVQLWMALLGYVVRWFDLVPFSSRDGEPRMHYLWKRGQSLVVVPG